MGDFASITTSGIIVARGQAKLPSRMRVWEIRAHFPTEHGRGVVSTGYSAHPPLRKPPSDAGVVPGQTNVQEGHAGCQRHRHCALLPLLPHMLGICGGNKKTIKEGGWGEGMHNSKKHASLCGALMSAIIQCVLSLMKCGPACQPAMWTLLYAIAVWPLLDLCLPDAG